MPSPSPCARCSQVMGQSCCEAAQGEPLATLTWSDVLRAQKASGLAPKEFAQVDTFSDEEATEYERARPLYEGYFAQALARLTLRAQEGACVFLDRKKGCRLSESSRPLACRLYPFEVLRDGSIGLQLGRAEPGGFGCLAIEEATSMAGVRRAFKVREEEIHQLAAQIRREVLQHAQEEDVLAFTQVGGQP